MSRSGWRTSALVATAFCLTQLAWIWCLPAFAGIDEFDHAYRAAAVARGEWQPGLGVPPAGRGLLVTVPRDVVEAASPECAFKAYTGRSNCWPVSTAPSGLVTVASAAATYNPVFYWVTGTAGRAFSGRAALYAMRAAGALMCALFVAIAAWALGVGARTRWPLMTLVVAVSPMVVYSTIVAAPNGLEMASGAAMWSVVIALARGGLPTTWERQLIVAGTLCAVTLATLRTMGPFWLALILGFGVVLAGREATWGLAKRNPRIIATSGTVTALAVAAAVGWTLWSGANQPETHDHNGAPWAHAALGSLVWPLQAIGAFPYRAQPAPAIVYLCAGSVFLFLLLRGWRAGTGRQRAALLLTVLATLAIPFVITGLTYAAQGYVWQGRYGLPLSVGIALLCGHALDHADRPELSRLSAWLAGGALLVAHVASSVGVLALEKRTSPSLEVDGWWVPSLWSVIFLYLVAASVLSLALRGGGPRGRSRAVSSSAGPLAEGVVVGDNHG